MLEVLIHECEVNELMILIQSTKREPAKIFLVLTVLHYKKHPLQSGVFPLDYKVSVYTVYIF